MIIFISKASQLNHCLLHAHQSHNKGGVSDRSVRLIGGKDSREGIVEIAYNGRWGMLCNNGFSTPVAQSICQGLGFGTDKAEVMSSTTR